MEIYDKKLYIALKLVKVFKVICYVFGWILLITPVLFWWQNPELTQIQIIIKTWHYTIGGIAILISANYL